MECQKKSIENITTSDSNFAPALVNFYTLPYLKTLPYVKFNGHCFINKFLDSGKVINQYIYW